MKLVQPLGAAFTVPTLQNDVLPFYIPVLLKPQLECSVEMSGRLRCHRPE